MSREAPAFAGLWPWEPITPSDVADVLRGPLEQLGPMTSDGLPFLSPEIALFYMLSRPTPKAKADFLAACPRLSAESRDWLRRSLELAHPGHPVLPLL